jgi:hypothetical protein
VYISDPVIWNIKNKECNYKKSKDILGNSEEMKINSLAIGITYNYI